MVELYFLNLQYWYCVIYSLFGGNCTYLDELRAGGVDVPFDGAGPGGVDAPTFFGRIMDAYTSGVGAVWEPIVAVFSFVWNTYSLFAWSASALLFLAILSAFAGLVYIRVREISLYNTLPLDILERKNPARDRWDELLEQVKSTHPTLWRQAIFEADHMLGDLLDRLGYRGATTADKMRNLPEDAFVTVPVAWEAHRIRNFVAYGSNDFILTQREAFRVMKLYEQVFEEFSVI